MPRKNPVLVKLMERRTAVQSELSKLTVELEWLNSVLTPPKAPVATPEAVPATSESPLKQATKIFNDVFGPPMASTAANPGADL